MKYIPMVLLLILFFPRPQAACQNTSLIDNRLVVYGTGTIEAPADRARLSFSVKGFGPTLGEAVAVARKKVADLAAELMSHGIGGASLRTSAFESGDNFEGKAFLSSSRDYRARIAVTVTIDSLERLEEVVTSLTKGSLDNLSDISFALKGDSTLRLEARRLAVENARIKADIMAKELHVELGKALSVEELLSMSDGDFYFSDKPLAYQAGTVRVGGATFYPQRFTVKAGARVSFELPLHGTSK